MSLKFLDKIDDKSLLLISSYDIFKSKADTKISDNSIGLTNSELQTYSDNTFGQLFKKANNQYYSIKTQDNCNMKLDPGSGSIALLYQPLEICLRI